MTAGRYSKDDLRAMALRVILAWNKEDVRYNRFMRMLGDATGLEPNACRKLLTWLAGY